MVVKVNGKEEEVEDGCTLGSLLARVRKVEGPCAVELNETLLPFEARDRAQLHDGDRIEIVTLVGGG